MFVRFPFLFPFVSSSKSLFVDNQYKFPDWMFQKLKDNNHWGN